MQRTTERIMIDGDLSDAPWRQAAPVGQWFETALSATALFAYKVNWQSVIFVGYGDDRELSEAEELERAGRELFVKVSYAFQR